MFPIMEWKPFARGLVVGTLSIAVLVGEEKWHLHVEVTPDFSVVAAPIVMQTSAPPIMLRLPTR